MTAWVCWERRSYQYFRLVWPPELVLDDLDGLGFIECVYGILQTACTASVCPCTDKTLSPSNQIRAGTGGIAHSVKISLHDFESPLLKIFSIRAETGWRKGCTRSSGYTFAAVIGLGLLNVYLPLQQAMEASKSAAVSTNSSCTA